MMSSENLVLLGHFIEYIKCTDEVPHLTYILIRVLGISMLMMSSENFISLGYFIEYIKCTDEVPRLTYILIRVLEIVVERNGSFT